MLRKRGRMFGPLRVSHDWSAKLSKAQRWQGVLRTSSVLLTAELSCASTRCTTSMVQSFSTAQCNILVSAAASILSSSPHFVSLACLLVSQLDCYNSCTPPSKKIAGGENCNQTHTCRVKENLVLCNQDMRSIILATQARKYGCTAVQHRRVRSRQP